MSGSMAEKFFSAMRSRGGRCEEVAGERPCSIKAAFKPSRRVMAGVDLVSVKEILGHKDIQTTLRYSHLAPGHLREAVNRGSLSRTVTETVTSQSKENEDTMQAIDSVVR